MDGKLIVSSSPHISSPVKTKNIMLDVIIALIPSLIASIYFFGPRAAVVVIASVATCVIAEYICRKVMKREQTIGDLSAVVTGILLAFNLPSSVPIYVPIIGGLVAIVMVKQMFGGLGQNFVNPALLARIILMNSFPVLMTTWYPSTPLWRSTSPARSAPRPSAPGSIPVRGAVSTLPMAQPIPTAVAASSSCTPPPTRALPRLSPF